MVGNDFDELFGGTKTDRESQWSMSAMTRFTGRLERRNEHYATRCGARTRRDGHPCYWEPEPGKKRCKFHGGRSTGPTTLEGKARIAAAQHRRWERWRAAKAEGKL
jgi:hypothetical protein